MASDENPGDIFVNALKFGVSNITSLVVWGMAFLIAIVVAMAIMIAAVLLFSDNELLMIPLMLLAYLPALAVGVLLLGFMVQCMKTVIDGGTVMPTGFESPVSLVKDGVSTLIIALEVVVVEMVFFAPAFLLMFLSAGSESVGLMLLAMALMFLMIPVIMVVAFLNMVQWAIYADTGSLLRGLNPLRAAGLIRSNPGGALAMVLLLIASNIVFTVVMFLCEILIITILLLPFLVIAMYGCMAYIIAVFYRQSSGERSPDVRDAAAGGHTVS